jgi:hypothetical protein
MTTVMAVFVGVPESGVTAMRLRAIDFQLAAEAGDKITENLKDKS